MKRMCRILAALFLITAVASAEDSIRSFPIPTIVALGKELYRRDQMAATPFDALFAANPKAGDLPLRGWITQVDKDIRCVYLIQERESKYSLAFTVTFPDNG